MTYAQLVKDRLFLSAEVMREYDQRFVYRKVFASRVDRGTQTNEGESELLGPWVLEASLALFRGLVMLPL